ncbi:MAG: ATP-binding cassette domain-containing protein [candidate division Zixibacteria bacterium]|nr:ATP-binding cassette domain-containing protein [candidate division Zixibacteria bacterium]
MLTLHDISKRYGSLQALHPLTMEFPAEHITAIIGPSGCGKSTLLRILVGLVTPDTGTVEIDAEPLTPQNVLEMRHRMGYVIQDGGLFPHLTAWENVTLLARYLKWDRGKIDERVEEMRELTEFPKEGLNRYPVQLSGGQMQRVSLMRALMLDPEVLLLDEPLGALDPMIRASLQTDLRDIFRELGKAVVLVTHDMGEAGFFGDTIVLMRDGKVIQTGSLSDLLKTPADEFVTQFINAQRTTLESSEEQS